MSTKKLFWRITLGINVLKKAFRRQKLEKCYTTKILSFKSITISCCFPFFRSNRIETEDNIEQSETADEEVMKQAAEDG